MILRRLSQSLKEQNWMAITIEFVLLVVGVFLGIQVANWNEERRDHNREHAYLARIATELDESIVSIERSNALTQKRMDMNQLLIDSVAKPELVSAGPGRFVYAVTLAVVIPSRRTYAATPSRKSSRAAIWASSVTRNCRWI